MSVDPGPSRRCATSRSASAGMIERNWYLIKRYAWWELAFFFWTLANTLTIVFIAKGDQGGRRPDRRRPRDHDRC